MLKRTQRPLALVLALFMLVTLMPSMALARKWESTLEDPSTATSDGFIFDVASEQFTIGRDSNRYIHSLASFPNAYSISEDYLNRLLRIGSYVDQCNIINRVKMSWRGSCYGMAGTMVLNRLTRDKQLAADKELHIGQFQSGAKEYFDLGHPKDNPELLSMINYHYLWQYLGMVKQDYHHNVKLSPTGFEQDALNEFVETVKLQIDANRPYMFVYYYSGGGHAIVGTDYYEYTEDGKNHILLKMYDENDRWDGQDPKDAYFCYMDLIKVGDNYKTPYYAKTSGGDTVPAYPLFYDASEGASYFILSSISFIDIEGANEKLNIHNPQSLSPAPTEPVLEFSDIQTTYARYSIHPFGGSVAEPAFDENRIGVFDIPGEGYLPLPINKGIPGYYYNQMHVDSLHYTQSSAGERMPSVGIEFEMKTEGVAGYDIQTDGAGSFSMQKATDADSGNYASVQGSNLGTARFDTDGKLHLVTSKDDEKSDLQVFFGTRGTDEKYDMFYLAMREFSELNIVRDTKYPNDILLHGSGFENGIGFRFFKGDLQSEWAEGSTDAEDTWLRIGSTVADGKVEVSVWSAGDAAGGGIPTFPAKPDYTTIIDQPITQGGSAGSYEDSRNEYRLKSGEGELTYPGSGDFTFTVDAPFANYISTSIDGVPVERQFIDVKEGSTIITIREGFMKTLKAGEHRLRVQFTDGFMQCTLKVGAPSTLVPAAVPEVPATGDTLSMGLLALCTSLVSAAFVTGNKRRK